MKGLASNLAKIFYKGKGKSGRTEEKQSPDETRTYETVTEDRDYENAESSAAEGIMKSTEDPPNELKNRGKLFVGGLCHQTTSKGLEAYFSQFGKVIDAVVLRYPGNGRSRGFGFVTFADVPGAESAASADSHLLDGKKIDVRPFVSGKLNSKTSKKDNDFRVFLGGLPENVSTDLLKEFFGRYGEVNEVIIPLDKNTKKPKGFGFMSFESEDAVEKCLTEGFVHLGGRRIHIKRAKPRSSSHSTDEVEIAEDCLERGTLSAEDLILWDKMSTSSIVDNETISSTSGESCNNLPYCGISSLNPHMDYHSFQGERSEDFFSTERSNSNSNRKKTGEEDRNFTELLSDFLISGKIESWASDENLISFSDDSESEESNSGTHSHCDSDASDYDYATDAENEAKLIHHLKNELMKVLRDVDTSIVGVNSTGGGDCGDVQKSSPMKFRDNNGSLFCALCQWAPEDNSCESFLDHCRTVSHRNKLRDRFSREQFQIGRPTEESKSKERTDAEQKPSAQKPTVQQEISKSQEKIQTQGKVEKQNQAQQQQKAKNTGAKAAKKGGKGEIKNETSNPKPEECENKAEKNSVQGLKVMALAKGMSCIQPSSHGHLKCSMCKKTIPKSEDFNVVMKNVSMHLQSKGHLKKLLETENLLKESLERNQGETKSYKSVKNPPSLKVQAKAPSQEQKVQANAPSQEQIPKQKVQAKAPSQEQKVQAKAPSQEQKIPKQKVQAKAPSQEQKVQAKAPSQEQKVQANAPSQEQIPKQKVQAKAPSQEQKIPKQKVQAKAPSQEQKIPKQKVQAKAPSQEQKVQAKAPSQEQKVQANAPSQEQKVPNQKPQDKASAQKQKNVTKDMGKTKSQDNNSSSKLCFLCVPCNYLNSNIDLFKVHLKSESHLDCFISRGVSTNLSFDNLSTCKSCEMFLYGSLYYINKHYSKCSEKKKVGFV